MQFFLLYIYFLKIINFSFSFLISPGNSNLKLETIIQCDVGHPVQTNKQTSRVYHLIYIDIDSIHRVPVPDERFDWLVQHHKPASKVPAFLNVTDIAGLVKGASEGQGLGNAFLSHIKVG